FAKAFGKIFLAEALVDRGIGQQGLSNKSSTGIKILLFLPVDGNLRLIDFCFLFLFLHYASVSHGIVTSRFELVFVEDSQAAVGMGRNDVRVATAATRQSETDYPTPTPPSGRKKAITSCLKPPARS